MAELVSDPPFNRGQTLGVVAGQNTGVPGAVKQFLDVNPYTVASGRDGSNISNAIVRCRAVRNTSGGALLPGQVVKMKTAALLTEVDGLGDQTAGQLQGVVDEYLPAAGVQNGDVFWLVVRGPTTLLATSAAISQGAAIGPSTTAGSAVAGSGLGVALAAKALNATPSTVRALLTQAWS